MSNQAVANRPRWGRRVLIAALIVLGLLVAAAAWIGVRGVLAKGEFDDLVPLAGDVRNAASTGDLARIEALAPALREHAASAAALTGDPIWAAAEVIPVIGANLAAVRITASELSAIADVLPDLTAAGAGLAAPADGALISPTALAAAEAPLRAADDVIQDAAASLAGIDTASLIPQVADGVNELRDVVTLIAPATGAVTNAAAVLPSMLGGDGERSILVMIQNSAELRTGGGITGSFAELRAIDGRLELVRQVDSSAFAARTQPIIPLADSVTTLYSDVVGRFVQNVSMTTDFATTAEMASAWWSELTGTTPDTVISVDPFVLRALVSAVGPVDLPGGGQLTSDNLIDTLLVQPYRTMSSDEQSVLFSAATQSVFDRLSSGGVDPLVLATALAEPAAEGRISVWNAAADENAILSTSVFGGSDARQADAGAGAFGIYFNDATGAKMAEFLDISMTLTAGQCRTDGFADVAVSLTMASTAPADVASWPISVTGGGLFGVGAGDIGTNITVVGPEGSFAGEVIVKDEPYAAPTAVDDGRPASAARVNLSPAEVNTLVFHFLVPEDRVGQLALVHTPLMNAPQIQIVPTACS